jgi:hypothetical protein
MLNIRLRTLFTVLFLLISLTLLYGCSSKPPEEKMKKIIIDLYPKPVNSSNFNFEKFQITKDVKKKINGEKYYCIEANFKLTYDKANNGTTEKSTLESKQEHYCFVKRAKVWYGTKTLVTP